MLPVQIAVDVRIPVGIGKDHCVLHPLLELTPLPDAYIEFAAILFNVGIIEARWMRVLKSAQSSLRFRLCIVITLTQIRVLPRLSRVSGCALLAADGLRMTGLRVFAHGVRSVLF